MKALKWLFACMIWIVFSCDPAGFWPWSEQESLVISERVPANSLSAVHTANEWLVVVSAVDSSDHSGVLLLLRSREITGPWSRPDTVARNLQQFRFPVIKQFRDGKIWIQSEIGYLTQTSEWKPAGCIFLQSYDFGSSFTVSRPIFIRELREWSVMSSVIERNEGRLIIPIMNRTSGKIHQPGLIMSDNGGETWSKWIPMFPGESLMDVVKASVIGLNDDRILALFKTMNEDLLIEARSDDGLTWSDPFVTNIYGEEPYLMQSRDGDVLCSYRDSWPAGTSLMTSYDFGRTFENEITLESGEITSVYPAEYENGWMFLFTSAEEGVFSKILSIRKNGTPAGLSASIDHNSVRVRWNSVEDAVYYKVYKSCGIDSSTADTVPFRIVRSPVFTDTDIKPGVTYVYQISSVHGYGKLLSGSGSESLVSDECRIIIPS